MKMKHQNINETYYLLQIIVTPALIKGEEGRQKQDVTKREAKKINKREASLIIDNFPVETVYSQYPKVIFRRVSRQKYGPPKTKYESYRPKYGPPSPKTRKPAKKYRKHFNYKHRQSSKHRSPKPRYGPPKRPSKKPVYGPPKKAPPPYNTEPAGFAEPPVDAEPYYQPQNQNYAEPPVDSYGAPLKTTNEPYPAAPNYEAQNHYEHSDFSNLAQEYRPWQDFQQEPNVDNTFAYSKKRPIFIKPDELFDAEVNQEDDNIDHTNIYSLQTYKEPEYLNNRKKKPHYFIDSNKKVNKYWKSPRLRPEKIKVDEDDNDEEMLVGGQYAEPPARYVPKFLPSAPMFTGTDEFAPAKIFDYHTPTTSATISPYVNYINSNMAFSPQNLNDAFSSR
ncbi:unnamed protein product [Diatraea saccharalis]|uniref:Uncharacterized protein n=1 Tax=Diatraea saccharalis TaxID=40085 RepID=A0A9N9RBK1_9NEOP|nr:unnamed protein product [Diatraea saccharalis]